jgi:hypothetical protein
MASPPLEHYGTRPTNSIQGLPQVKVRFAFPSAYGAKQAQLRVGSDDDVFGAFSNGFDDRQQFHPVVRRFRFAAKLLGNGFAVNLKQVAPSARAWVWLASAIRPRNCESISVVAPRNDCLDVFPVCFTTAVFVLQVSTPLVLMDYFLLSCLADTTH